MYPQFVSSHRYAHKLHIIYKQSILNACHHISNIHFYHTLYRRRHKSRPRVQESEKNQHVSVSVTVSVSASEPYTEKTCSVWGLLSPNRRRVINGPRTLIYRRTMLLLWVPQSLHKVPRALPLPLTPPLSTLPTLLLIVI